ncbi:hypothetical protein GCM10023084_57160 [Streptomyces lacrimifluminis]|uniref:Uncharacterized protein n=1 Tax=Streptomyces lacrimifluminis TaxID=1500077 RepID=A0A917P1X3_9ACTN|nr:hypothetical protein GCM10012282_58850 [Streptomyces lacrimifluminis]
MVCPRPAREQAAPAGRPARVAVPDSGQNSGPVGGSIAATGPERGRVEKTDRVRVAKDRASEPRGPGPVSSALFPLPLPVPGRVLDLEQVVVTITDPARDKAARATVTLGTKTAPAAGTAADLAAVPVVGTDPDPVTDTVEDTRADTGPVTPTAPTTTAVTRTATVTAMARQPLSPSTCGRSSGRF